MLQSLEKDLKKFHELFQEGRCQAWQLEELIAKAIRSDFSKNESVTWKGNGHDIGCDIIINGKHRMQIKSGTIKKENLILSGYRLGRFKGDFKAITHFLNQNSYFLVAVPYHTEECQLGKKHIYQLFYIDSNILTIDDYKKWKQDKSSYKHINKYGVELSIRPSMSWQIWWKVPLNHLSNNKTRLITI